MQPGRAEERDGDEFWRLAALQGNGEAKFLTAWFNIVAMGILRVI